MKTAERRRFVVAARLQGWNYRQIADGVAKKFADDLPKGYDERYAYKDFARELKKLQAEVRESVNELRLLQLERLDDLLKGVWERAKGGSTKDIYAALAIMERVSKLTGLDAPELIEMNRKFNVELTWDGQELPGSDG